MQTKRTDPSETQVLIIGAGVTGTGLARDLTLRGLHCVLVDKRDINAGASGANHGLLHSGARYVSTDPVTAKECAEEAKLLKRLAPHCIEDTGGLFVAVEGDDEEFISDFPQLCSQCGVSARPVDAHEACEMEPGLSKKLIKAYAVEDSTIDPFMLSLENLAQAQQLGASFFPHTRLVGFRRKANRISGAHLLRTETGKKAEMAVKYVVNAAGAWAGEVAALAGAPFQMLYSKGSLLITGHRLTNRVINRLRRPADGDILVPGGTVSILGTTSTRTQSLEDVHPTIEEVDLIVSEGAMMFPDLENTRYVRAYAGVRPLVSLQCEEDDRSVSRGFVLLDHQCDGLENLATISGGKLTTYRLMAEKAANLVCARLGVSQPCLTRTQPLPSSDSGKWTEPGLGPKLWLEGQDPKDPLLCECEMLPRSAIDHLIRSLSAQGAELNLQTIRMRSRMGKGPCQGTFCGMRVTGHMYNRGLLHSDQGIENLRAFLRERWTGERPVLWGDQLIQAEFKEALYCGLLGIEC